MITVLVSTTNRPEMLRTALRSIEKQTARDAITLVVVSENAGNRDSAKVCAEFPSLPIKYKFRDPPLFPMEHCAALLSEIRDVSNPYLAILHDDDWWGSNHIANGLEAFKEHPDAVAYWATSFLLYGESSWFLQCWNESCWIVSGFKPVTEVAKLDLKQAALACVGSGPAHYSSLIGKTTEVTSGLLEVIKTRNLHDNDRLLFLDLAKRGPLLINFVPEVFVRQHPRQDQKTLTVEQSTEHVAAATRAILDFCNKQEIDIVAEYGRLYEECPVPSFRPYLIGTMDPRVVQDLMRLNSLPLPQLVQPHQLPPPPPLPPPEPPPPPANLLKRIARQLCPPFVWNTASIGKNLLLARVGMSNDSAN